MTTGGLIFLIASWGIIITLVIFAFSKVLGSGGAGGNDDSD